MSAPHTPTLRFKDENGKEYPSWKHVTIGDIFKERVERAPTQNSTLLSVTINSGIVPQSTLKRKTVQSADISNYKVVKENDIAYNTMRMWQGASGLSAYDGIVSPAYTVITAKDDHVPSFWAYYFKLQKMVHTFERNSQGLTPDTWNIKFNLLSKVKIVAPDPAEQQRIVDFLVLLDQKESLLSQRISLLKNYRNGLLQRVLLGKEPSSPNGIPWAWFTLEDLLKTKGERNKSQAVKEVFSIAKEAGVINQIEHLGRSYAASDLRNYKTVRPGDMVYTKSPTGDFPYGIIKQNHLDRTGLVSSLYAVYEPKNIYLGRIIEAYFSSPKRTYNYLNPIVQKGAKNTINIGDSAFLRGKPLHLPVDPEEQRRLSETIQSIDQRLQYEQEYFTMIQSWRRTIIKRILTHNA